MAYSVPNKNSAVDSAKTGAIQGGPLALGEALGRSVLGPGLGTLLGGIAVASAADGDARDVMATIAVERGATEAFAGSNNTQSSTRGRM